MKLSTKHAEKKNGGGGDPADKIHSKGKSG